ncbi:MAG: hypothetical protein A2428_13330 [Bdellovibrionales bacterium RIFOXYC1_FULL_54_43]|nr:MAG: hypothetical protein A2428_13330 [Bdellovibrionales bacterium RIFOXYC1_FULL_54_43]OFZ85765.1 MAG: hypothetical protein A2603_08790 [Bdellovibrionales bacterium RIFOXYD1_FULL_55_31]
MLLPPYELNQKIRLIRVFAGLNQADMAQLLGMTQSWVSKVEAGMGDLTVAHLNIIRKKFEISADAIIDGTIPYSQISKTFNAPLKLPKKYTHGANCRVRLLYGFVSLFEERLGIDATLKFFRSKGIAPEVLADPDLRVSMAMVLDFMSFGMKTNLLTEEGAWEKIARCNIVSLLDSGSGFTQGSPKEAFARVGEISRRYTTDFNYQIISVTDRSADIYADHVRLQKWLGSNNSAFGSALGSYHKAVLEALGRLDFKGMVQVNTLPQAPEHCGFAYRATWN